MVSYDLSSVFYWKIEVVIALLSNLNHSLPLLQHIVYIYILKVCQINRIACHLEVNLVFFQFLFQAKRCIVNLLQMLLQFSMCESRFGELLTFLAVECQFLQHLFIDRVQFYDFPRIESTVRTAILLRYLIVVLKAEEFLAPVAFDYLIRISHGLEADRANEDGSLHLYLLNTFDTDALVSLLLHLSLSFWCFCSHKYWLSP